MSCGLLSNSHFVTVNVVSLVSKQKGLLPFIIGKLIFLSKVQKSQFLSFRTRWYISEHFREVN